MMMITAYDDDYSMRLIEWIEMVRILGADHIFFNILRIHSNMSCRIGLLCFNWIRFTYILDCSRK